MLRELDPKSIFVPKYYNIPLWMKELAQFRSKEELNKLADELQRGVDIGIQQDNLPEVSTSCIPPPADDWVERKLAQVILKWYERGQILGPFTIEEGKEMGVRAAPVHGVPKHGGDEIRPVVHHSWPSREKWRSVNGKLRPELCTVNYVGLAAFVATAQLHGPGAWIWSRDLEDGYFNCNLRKEDQRWFAFKWKDMIWIPTVMVFGISSAPKIFTDFMQHPLKIMRMKNPVIGYIEVQESTALPVLMENEVDIIRTGKGTVLIPCTRAYVDDFNGVHAKLKCAWQQFNIYGSTLKRLNLSPKEAKDKYPAQRQICLGTLIDTLLQRLFLPKDKHDRYVQLILDIIRCGLTSGKQLQTVVGQTRYAASLLRPLCAFVRGLENHQKGHDEEEQVQERGEEER